MRRLPVTGLGLVTALGDGATGSCAALRAELSAIGEASAVEVDDGEGGSVPAVASPTAYADGFFQTGAWVRLAGGALEDLLDRTAGVAAPAAGRAAFAAAAPILDEERLAWTAAELPGPLERHYAAPLRARHAIDAAPELRFVSAAGHCALAELLAACGPLLDRGADRVFLAAADSYLDPLSLDWLARGRRLKSASCPTGLVPGEAGAALLIEPEAVLRRRGGTVLGFVDAVALRRAPPPAPRPDDEGEDDPPPALPDAVAVGRALAEAVAEVLPPGEMRFEGDLYLDLNGEEWRARAFGLAQVLLARRVDLDRCRTFLPAMSVGELGAAAAPVALALALWTFDREGARDALILSTSDGGQVAAVRLSAPAARTT